MSLIYSHWQKNVTRKSHRRFRIIIKIWAGRNIISNQLFLLSRGRFLFLSLQHLVENVCIPHFIDLNKTEDIKFPYVGKLSSDFPDIIKTGDRGSYGKKNKFHVEIKLIF